MFTVHSPILLLVLCLAASAGEEALRAYDLTDLLAPIVDFPAPELGVVATDRSSSEPSANANDPAYVFEQLIVPLFDPPVMTLIRSSSQLRGGTLFLTAQPEVHAHVERVFARQRARQSLQVQVECVLALMDPRIRTSRFTFPGVPWKPLAAHPGLLVAEQTQAEVEVMLAALRGDNDVAIAERPSITAFAGQQVHTAFVHQLAYLPLHLTEGPEVRQVSEALFGDVLELRATPTADLSLITLKLTHRRSSLLEQRVIETGGTPAEVPIIWTGEVQVDQVLVAGHSLVIATGVYLDAKTLPQCGFLIVTPTVIAVDGKPVNK